MTDTGIPPAEIKVGKAYRTHAATWRVTSINAGMVYVTREDGRTATFGLKEFAGWVIATERG